VDDIGDQTGKVTIVTGGNSGIGKETCKVLLAKGARVYMGARSRERAEEALLQIKQETGKDDIHWLPMDLADLASVKRAAAQFLGQEKELHVLYNNAGIMATPFGRTVDGYELQWGTNLVGHWAFTKLLLPILEHTASLHPQGTVRVINVSSMGHNFAPSGGIVFDDLALTSGYWFVEWKRYGQSKLGNILLTKEIARRYGDKGIYSISLHPGSIHTNLVESTWIGQSVWVRKLYHMFGWGLYTPHQGALTQLYAGTSPDIVTNNLNGSYLDPIAVLSRPSVYARDPELAKKLWDHLEQELGDLGAF